MGVVSPFAVDTALLTMRMGLPTAMTWHCMLDRFAPVVSGLGMVRRWARRGMAMSAVSDVAAAPLRRILGGDGRVTVVPNGIDVDAWRPRDRPRARGRTVRIVTAMRLATRKRPVPLLEVVRRMRELVPDEVPVQRGDPRRRAGPRPRSSASCASTAWSAGSPSRGRSRRDELKARYAAADVYISPGELESFGIAALEARTAGLPVVGRKGSGVGEFVTDGVNGLLAVGRPGDGRRAGPVGLRPGAAGVDACSQPRAPTGAGLVRGGGAGRVGVPPSRRCGGGRR